ncbi:hypothetical protein K439DRAFT_1618508 [Ramaria rubella]|nr:hypothetical protein K439DRAFT_1618508 [Ramaria rubella]
MLKLRPCYPCLIALLQNLLVPAVKPPSYLPSLKGDISRVGKEASTDEERGTGQEILSDLAPEEDNPPEEFNAKHGEDDQGTQDQGQGQEGDEEDDEEEEEEEDDNAQQSSN